MKKDLLKLLDLTSEEILKILDTADTLKDLRKRGIQHPFLAGKTLAMIFEKSSTRTRVSFETGIYQLGGNGIYLSDKDSQIGRSEPVEDTARVLSRYCDGIMIRTFAQEEVETLAKYATIPVINGLTDFCHPCQVLADLQTIREHKGKLEGLKLCEYWRLKASFKAAIVLPCISRFQSKLTDWQNIMSQSKYRTLSRPPGKSLATKSLANWDKDPRSAATLIPSSSVMFLALSQTGSGR